MSTSSAADPNFPSDLHIKPSSRSQQTVHNPRWCQDTEEDIEQYGIAGRIWEAAYLLALYFRPNPLLEFDPPCSILQSSSPTAVELGSGAGFSGLHLASQLDSRHALVVLTDLPNVVPLMERNAAHANLLQPCVDARFSDAAKAKVLVRPLAWGNQQHAKDLLDQLAQRSHIVPQPQAHPLTHVICSDLVYFPELLPPLLRSLIHLSDPFRSDAGNPSSSLQSPVSTPEVIISYKIRSLIKEQPFWSAFGAWFDYEVVNCRAQPPASDATSRSSVSEWHRFGSERSDLQQSASPPHASDTASGDELFIFVARRRPESLGCVAPDDDKALMDGKRLRLSPQTQVDGPESESCWVLEIGSQGQDLFEWLLLSGMGEGIY